MLPHFKGDRRIFPPFLLLFLLFFRLLLSDNLFILLLLIMLINCHILPWIVPTRFVSPFFVNFTHWSILEQIIAMAVFLLGTKHTFFFIMKQKLTMPANLLTYITWIFPMIIMLNRFKNQSKLENASEEADKLWKNHKRSSRWRWLFVDLTFFSKNRTEVLAKVRMWCDQAKCVWSRKIWFFWHFLIGYYVGSNLVIPYRDWAIVCKDTNSWRIELTIRNKRNYRHCLVSLNNNICEFWLILLDHITKTSSLVDWKSSYHRYLWKQNNGLMMGKSRWSLLYLFRKIIPLRIAVVCTTWCNSGICQSGEVGRQTFVHCHGSWIQIKAYRKRCPSQCQLYLHDVSIKWRMTLWQPLRQTQIDVETWIVTIYKGLHLLLTPLWQMPLWHYVAHTTAIHSGIISLRRCEYGKLFWGQWLSKLDKSVPAHLLRSP